MFTIDVTRITHKITGDMHHVLRQFCFSKKEEKSSLSLLVFSAGLFAIE
jgi:hypothetical protein